MKLIPCLLCILIIVACKKKQQAISTIVSVPSNDNYGGELNTLIKQYNIGNTILQQDSVAYCYFVTKVNNLGDNKYAGNVSYNGTLFKYHIGDYQDTTFILNLHQLNSVWNIGGSPSVQAFNFTYAPSYPVFNGNNLLPDSISISTGFTLNLASSFSNATDSVDITIGFSAYKRIGAKSSHMLF